MKSKILEWKKRTGLGFALYGTPSESLTEKFANATVRRWGTVDGEEVFNKYARFTSGRLSFYDKNDTEVAYISDYKLHISNVEITYSYKIGGLVDTVMLTGDVVEKWVGRG